MSETLPSGLTFGTEPYAVLLQRASQKIWKNWQHDEIPEAYCEEWLANYYDEEILPDRIAAWQNLSEAVYRYIPTDVVATTTASTWLKAPLPPLTSTETSWPISLAHFQLSTADPNDQSHQNGRFALDKLETLYPFVVDERDYRTRVLAALLPAHPDIRIRQYEVATKPFKPELVEPTVHIMGEGYFGRSLMERVISYPYEGRLNDLQMFLPSGEQRKLTVNEMLGYASQAVAYNQIYDEITFAVRAGNHVAEPPLAYLVEELSDSGSISLRDVR